MTGWTIYYQTSAKIRVHLRLPIPTLQWHFYKHILCLCLYHYALVFVLCNYVYVVDKEKSNASMQIIKWRSWVYNFHWNTLTLSQKFSHQLHDISRSANGISQDISDKEYVFCQAVPDSATNPDPLKPSAEIK